MSDMLVIRGGRVVNPQARRANPADVLVAGDTILEIGPPGLVAPNGTQVIQAQQRLLIPGLINAHTHSHANLPRSLGDRWTLELALNGNTAGRENLTNDDKYLSAQIGAVEMISKGCTACYDLIYYPKRTGCCGFGRSSHAYGFIRRSAQHIYRNSGGGLYGDPFQHSPYSNINLLSRGRYHPGPL